MDNETRDPRRVCLHPECTTTLSVYNVDYLCFTHADERSRARFDRRFQPRITSAARHGQDEKGDCLLRTMTRLWDTTG